MKTNQWALASRMALCPAVLATMMMGCSEQQATTRPETLAAQTAAAQAVAEPKEASVGDSVLFGHQNQDIRANGIL